MKKYILMVALGLLSFYNSFAQPEQKGKEVNIAESLKVAYITKELNLTSTEAEKFWPVYNTYLAEMKKAKKSNIKTQDPLALEEQILNIRKKYRDSFKKILGSDERANKLFIAESEYGKMIRKEWQKRVQQFRKNKENDKETANPPVPSN